MELRINDVDYAPDDLYDQVPVLVTVERQLPGRDRPDYWLAKAHRPIRWSESGTTREIKYLILAARWEGTQITCTARHLPVSIAYVIDESVLSDVKLAFAKTRCVAIGTVDCIA